MLTTPSPSVRLGSDYVVTFTTSSAGVGVNNVVLDGVHWYLDFRARRMSCTGLTCTFSRSYRATSVGDRTHTVTATRADGSPHPPVTIRVTVEGGS
jgi:hypothetical protein